MRDLNGAGVQVGHPPGRKGASAARTSENIRPSRRFEPLRGIIALAFRASARPARKSGDCGIGREQTCELRDDSKVGVDWDVLMLQDTGAGHA